MYSVDIALDFVGTSKESGTKTFNYNFCKNLAKKKLRHKVLLIITNKYAQELKIKANKNLKIIKISNLFEKIFFRILWMNLILPYYLKIFKVRTLFSPMNISPLFIKFLNIKSILGIHTTLPWEYPHLIPGNYLRNLIMKKVMEISLKNADKILFCSKTSRKILKKKIKIKSQTKVIYLGPGNIYKQKKLPGFDYNENYILSIISCARYHLILDMIKSFKKVEKKLKNKIKFILVTSVLDQNYYLVLKNYIIRNNLKDKIKIIKGLQSSYLAKIYKKSKMYIFSSLSETFGFTTIEAMKYKKIVLCSKKSSLPEINSNAVVYFDPKSTNDLAKKIELYLNKSKQKKFLKRGTERAAFFCWKKNFNQTFYELYNSTK